MHDENDPSADKWPTREKQITLEEAKAGTKGMLSFHNINRSNIQSSELEIKYVWRFWTTLY